MSLGRKYSALLNDNGLSFDLSEPMTLANACYLLYIYMKK